MSSHLIPIEDAFNDLLSCAAFLAEDIKSADGRADAMKLIVPHYIDQGNVDLAAELADTVDDPLTRDRLLAQVAEKCAAINDDEYAFQLVEAIEDHGMQSQARERIALQMNARGDIDAALDLAESLEHPDEAYAGIAYHLYENGDASRAMGLLEDVEFPNSKSVALQNLAASAWKKGNKAEAAEFLNSAAEAATEIDFTEEKIRTMVDIGNNFTDVGRKDRAIETLDKAKHEAELLDNIHRDAFLSTISLGFFKAGSVDLADRTLDLVDDKTHIAATLVGFAREMWEAGEKDEALEALEESFAVIKSQHERETRNTRAKLDVWRTIAAQFAGFGKGLRAIEAAQELPDENEQFAALGHIAQVLGLQGEDELAEQAIRGIGEDLQKMYALIGLSDTKNVQGKVEESQKLLNDAAYHAGLVEQLTPRATAFTDIARRFDAHGMHERARETTHESLETIARIRDESNRAACLAGLAELFAEKQFTLTEEERRVIQRMLVKAES